jgi:hypothetical protein
MESTTEIGSSSPSSWMKLSVMSAPRLGYGPTLPVQTECVNQPFGQSNCPIGQYASVPFGASLRGVHYRTRRRIAAFLSSTTTHCSGRA